jgi:acyl-ACP thioesterase
MNKLEKTGTFHFVTESWLLDFRGRITIPMMGNYLLHAASDHASQRGFGFSDMTEKRIAWVLSRLAVEINRYPEISESVTLYTWIDEVGRLFTSRCFELTDSAGLPVVFARSIWAAIDLQTRRPTPLDVGGLSVYLSDRPCPIERPGKIAPVENETEGIPYQVKYSDLDINGHFNSLKYIEHILDLFEPDLFREKEIRRFEIAYLSEGRYGMPLALHRKEMEPDRYNMAVCHEGKAICRAMADWTER